MTSCSLAACMAASPADSAHTDSRDKYAVELSRAVSHNNHRKRSTGIICYFRAGKFTFTDIVSLCVFCTFTIWPENLMQICARTNRTIKTKYDFHMEFETNHVS
jgi:hypothetical protein